jgi:GTP cyclohydrolase II
MTQHVNIENDEVTIPYYAVYKDGMILGFFGQFRFLSNFFILENGVNLDEIYYPSVEHAYQAAKWPHDQREQFLGVTAGESKKIGREAPKFNAKKWEKQKVALMTALCRQKFINNIKLKQMLLMTEGCQLEERNSWGDVFWGRNENGEGQNQLGQILMDIRHDLLTKKEMF